MVREIISVDVGQAGCQLGQCVWDQYNEEHQISPTGKRNKNVVSKDKSFQCFYQESNSKQYVPRSLSIDLEPNTIDDIKAGKMSKMFHPKYLIAGKEDAANNFARGHYTKGRDLLDKISDRLRKLADACDNLQGFVMNHSVGGGTGSGLGSLILERMAIDYKKKSKLGFEIFPSRSLSTCVVESYNACLATHWLLDHTEVSLILDNEAIYRLVRKKLEIKSPSYSNLNRLITKVISSMTASLRFKGELNVDLNEFQTNLVPFPRLHFMMSSLAPVLTEKKIRTNKIDTLKITDECFQPYSWLVAIPDFDPENDKYMAISLNYRGDTRSKESNSAVQWLKKNNKVSFVEWCPTGFKIGLNNIACAKCSEDDMGYTKQNVTMIGNNTSMSRVFGDRIVKKFDLMYSQRAFVHWYVSEGMEEGEFAEAREDLGFLEKDYLDVLTEGGDDDEDDI